MHVEFVDIAGIRTRYYRAGEGPAVILVHGTSASSDTWVRNIDAIAAAGFRVFALDLIGHGFTDFEDMSAVAPQSRQARHLLAFADAMGLSSYALVGHSFGGLVMALAYLERPKPVTALVFVATASVFHPADEQERILREGLANQMQAYDHPSLESLRRRNVGSNFIKSDTFEEILLVQLTYHALPGRRTAVEQTIGGLIRTADARDCRVLHRLEEFRAPSLVIAGRHDPRVNPRFVSDGVARMPDVDVKIYEECGHKPYSEHAARFNADMIDFLNRTKTAPLVPDQLSQTTGAQ
jgi:pimeloyl-ACP methyl ester carboxylesterase